ncbi:MAG: TetR/AcrR family transcriptional regulator [Pseudomonadota bacterium]
MTKRAPQGSPEIWLQAAYEVLTDAGVSSVKIMTLAKRTGLTRTGFYWHFRDLDALLDALVDRWEATNTGNLVARAGGPAETITEAILYLFDCWIDPHLFDARLDLAIRNWALLDPGVKARLDRADAERTHALIAMFERFGYTRDEAEVRSLSVLYTQIGYISMGVSDPLELRQARIPYYAEVFTGLAPDGAELADFRQRHPASGSKPSVLLGDCTPKS